MKKDYSLKIRFRKAMALLICASMCFMVFSQNAYAKTVSEAENEVAQLDSEKEELDAQLNQLKEDESKKAEYQETLQAKVQLVEKQINETRANIEELDNEIAVLEAKIAKSEEEMGDTLRLYKESVKDLYIIGSSSGLGTLEALMDSESIQEYSVKNEMTQSVTKRNEMIMNQIEDYIKATADTRETCQSKKLELAEKKKKLEVQQEELDGLYRENQQLIMEIQAKQGNAEERLEQIKAEKQQLSDEIKKMVEEEKKREEEARKSGAGATGNNTIDPSVSGNFSDLAWPLPGVTYMSQYYDGAGHYGVDIAGPSGTPIVAVADGVVSRSNGVDWWGMGWGYHVVVKHNSTYTTLYAHMSAVAVNAGDSVVKGQTIGYEGSTGWSTGPHLHFEVYQNGSLVDPWPFIGF